MRRQSLVPVPAELPESPEVRVRTFSVHPRSFGIQRYLALALIASTPHSPNLLTPCFIPPTMPSEGTSSVGQGRDHVVRRFLRHTRSLVSTYQPRTRTTGSAESLSMRRWYLRCITSRTTPGTLPIDCISRTGIASLLSVFTNGLFPQE